MTRSDATTTPPTTVRTRRGSRRTLPMPPLGTPEHRAVIEHSIEAYADVTRRFQLTPDEARDTAEGLRAHARRYGLAIPYYLQSWGLGGGGTPTHGLYPDVETLKGSR
jgi:hypothetical protein